MLELLLRIPNESLRLLKCERTNKNNANVALRGFSGEVEYYLSEESKLTDSFWVDFTSGGEYETKNQKDASSYQQMVKSAIENIENHELNKVVLSRKFYWDCPRANPRCTFEALSKNYPDCTVFAIKEASIGAWMGASPEILLESTQEGFRSMSLAGTRLEGANHWGSKEIAEQKFVTKEVHKSLKSFGGRITRDKQETFHAGPVEHLLTWVNTDNSVLNPKELVEELHPTPAICGTPVANASLLIQQLEGYDRSLYTGYLALFEDQVHAAVLLRTMEWFDSGVQFYAGGGITKDSVPLDEWMETEYKISALKELIHIDDLR